VAAVVGEDACSVQSGSRRKRILMAASLLLSWARNLCADAAGNMLPMPNGPKFKRREGCGKVVPASWAGCAP